MYDRVQIDGVDGEEPESGAELDDAIARFHLCLDRPCVGGHAMLIRQHREVVPHVVHGNAFRAVRDSQASSNSTRQAAIVEVASPCATACAQRPLSTQSVARTSGAIECSAADG